MIMIYKIEMSIPSYTVIIKDNKGIINDKSIFITKDDISDIARIIRLWKSVYKKDIINESKYYIKLFDKDDNNIGDYTFDGDYPDNFYALVSLVSELYAR